jgi:flagellar basal-body rod protein FlgG
MRAQELVIDNTANNLANVNTTGFKRSILDFADLMYDTVRQPGTEVATGQQTPTGLQIGNGVRAVGTTKIFTTGEMFKSGNVTDVAIEGNGFFKVLLPSNEARYTRDGSLRWNVDGELVTSDGYQLESAITVQNGIVLETIRIGADGTVSGFQAGAPDTPVQLGQLQLYRFQNPAGLSSEGGNLYSSTPSSGPGTIGTPGLDGLGTLRQQYVELSNVEVVTELITLITAQRAYEINSRAIQAGDEMLSVSSQITR